MLFLREKLNIISELYKKSEKNKKMTGFFL